MERGRRITGEVLQVHDAMNAGELGLGAALPALEAAAGGADKLRQSTRSRGRRQRRGLRGHRRRRQWRAAQSGAAARRGGAPQLEAATGAHNLDPTSCSFFPDS